MTQEMNNQIAYLLDLHILYKEQHHSWYLSEVHNSRDYNKHPVVPSRKTESSYIQGLLRELHNVPWMTKTAWKNNSWNSV
jgi:hypothetical protein